jgi:hypothetical protein
MTSANVKFIAPVFWILSKPNETCTTFLIFFGHSLFLATKHQRTTSLILLFLFALHIRKFTSSGTVARILPPFRGNPQPFSWTTSTQKTAAKTLLVLLQSHAVGCHKGTLYWETNPTESLVPFSILGSGVLRLLFFEMGFERNRGKYMV